MDQATYNAIMATAPKAGMDPAYWTAIASIESSLNSSSNYNNPETQYKGLYQIGSRGKDSEWARRGTGDIYNPMNNATAAAALAADNNQAFQDHFGRAPTPIETYMMHQQGLGFYTHGTMTNITGNLPKEDQTPQNMTHEGFERYWANKLEARAQKFGGGGAMANWTPMQIAAAEGGPSGGVSSKWKASASDGEQQGTGYGGDSSTDVSTDTSTSDDDVAKFTAASTAIAKAAQQDQPPPMQWMAPVQPMITPAMIRAKAMAQAMLANPVGGGSTQT